MGDLFERVRGAVRGERYLFSDHADNMLRERSIVHWQVVDGLEHGRLLVDRPAARPKPLCMRSEDHLRPIPWTSPPRAPGKAHGTLMTECTVGPLRPVGCRGFQSPIADRILYLWEVMKETSSREFAKNHGLASLLSFGVFALFAATGEFLFVTLFQVRLDAFRIFGGLLILLVAIRYFTHGPGANILFRGKATDLAPEISLPYLVGPGTIWVSVLIGKDTMLLTGLAGIALVLAVNWIAVCAVHPFMSHFASKGQTVLGKYFAILMRTNALFVGAIAVEMIVSGLQGALSTGPRHVNSGG